MEKLNYNYSFKNIPALTKMSYQLVLIEKIESVIKRMRWKAHFFLNADNKENNTKTSFGFKSRYHLPPCNKLEHFEKGLLNIISNVKFTNNKNSFQKKLRADKTEIKNSRNIYVFADKTNNVYKMPTSEHNKLLKENVTKTYKKAPEKLQKSINLEAKSIATKLNLSGRIEKLAEAPAYITLKDHKENFRSKPPCRLINPSKNEIERISKIVSETINKKLLKELDFNQWMNTDDVIRWFRNIPNKSKYKFIQLDIKEFYPLHHKKIVKQCNYLCRELHSSIKRGY